MWHFDPNRSFQSQMDPKLFNFIPKVIIVAPKTFQRFMFCIWEIFVEKFERFSLRYSNFVNIWARKTFFFINRSEFRQKLIVTIISVLMRQPRLKCGISKDRPILTKCHIRSEGGYDRGLGFKSIERGQQLICLQAKFINSEKKWILFYSLNNHKINVIAQTSHALAGDVMFGGFFG